MILLKFDTEIKGDSTAKGFEDQIRLDHTSFTAARQLQPSNGGKERVTGTPTFTELQCSKSFDIASTELFMQSVSGDSLKNGTLTFLQTDTDGNPQVFLEVTMVDPIILSYAISASPDGKPHESFTISFIEIKLAYTQYNGENATKASPKGWNLQASKAA